VIIDAHNHLGIRLGAQQDAAQLVAKMDRAGVDRAVCFPFVEGNFTNDPVRKAVEQFPDRIIPFCAVNPWGPGAREELRACVDGFGAKGVKLHPTLHGYRLSDAEVTDPVVEVIDEFGLVIICHGGSDLYNSPAEFAIFTARYPNIRVLMAHSGMFWLNDEAIEVAKQRRNLFLETSRVPVFEVARSVAAIGADRVVFGTDSPFVDYESEVTKLRRAVPDEEDFKQVAGGNLAKLLGLDGEA
jgi:predicted TIM-barrel fold metal-dependent hydrolase